MTRRQLVLVGWAVIVANVVVTLFNLFGRGTWYLAPVSIFAVGVGVVTLRQVHRLPRAKQWWEK